MSSSGPNPRALASSLTNAPSTAREKSYFETQRATLIGEIAISMEHVLANINKLNRSLEGVIAVGNEFGSVEALWSQFENVMARDPEVVGEAAAAAADGGQDRQGERDETSSGDAGGR